MQYVHEREDIIKRVISVALASLTVAYNSKFQATKVVISPLIFGRKYKVWKVFLIGCIIRLIPEIIAYPYPIGYDVTNYYIPVLADFQAEWDAISNNFPLYAVFLHMVQIGTGLHPQSVVSVSAILMFGIFSVSIFFAGRQLFKLSDKYCLFLTIFVSLQLAVLRTTWDLHRDILSLTTMFLALSIINCKNANKEWYVFVTVLLLSALTVFSDRMVGALFVASLVVYAVMSKSRVAILYAFFATCYLSSAILISNDIHYDIMRSESRDTEPTGPNGSVWHLDYNPTNLLILFGVINGPLVPIAILGSKSPNGALLKIPIIISGMLSFSWLFFPRAESLVADRWIILCGVFLSVLGGYGLIQAIRRIRLQRMHRIAAVSILALVAIVGFSYEALPYDRPLPFYAAIRYNIQPFMPLTMQFNSLLVEQNEELLSMISWINQNTPSNAVIVGEHYLRGWMKVKLEDSREFMSPLNSGDIYHLAKKHHESNSYLLVQKDKFSVDDREGEVQVTHANEVFSLLRTNN